MCGTSQLAPGLTRDVESCTHFKLVVPARLGLRQPPLNFDRVRVRPKSVSLGDRVRVAMLREDVGWFEFIDQGDRILDLHIVLSG